VFFACPVAKVVCVWGGGGGVSFCFHQVTRPISYALDMGQVCPAWWAKGLCVGIGSYMLGNLKSEK
jgi:hypothetical protein